MASTTNTKGAIAAAAKNEAPEEAKSPSNLMRNILDNANTKRLLQDSLKENAGAFSASVLDLYNSDTYLQKCDPRQVFGECLKAVSLKLPISKQLGFAYVIPYKKNGIDVPQFQLGYKGMIQLCMRTGEYKYINADVVYEGEYRGADRLTGHVDLNGERISDTIIGYFAYIETLNGFKKAVYWSKEKVIDHAKKFSKSYNSQNSVWKSNFDAMAIKTVLRNLLSKYGVMNVEMANAMQAEEPTNTENPIPSLDKNAEIEVDAQTAESPAGSPEEPPIDNPPPPDDYPFAE